jgi:hypothetical protein
MPDLVRRRRAQLSLVEQSPHYHDGQFHNQLPTPGFSGQKNMLAAWWAFLVTKRENARPAQPLPLVKTDLASLPSGQDVMVWLGHSSWYLQLAGQRILIDPVFSHYAAPFSFINKAFIGDYPVACRGNAGSRPADYLARSLRPSRLRHHQNPDAENQARGNAAGRWVASALLGNG